VVSAVGLISAPLALALQRCLEALQAPLGPADLALTLALLGLYAAWALPWGLRNGFLRRRWRPSPPRPLLRQAAALLWMPALVEELLFRVALLPRPGEGVPTAGALGWAALALAAFVAYHPLAGRLWYPAGRDLFHDPRFLGLCAGLGLICTLGYWATGSLLSPVLLHWLVVLVWLDPLEGAVRLRVPADGPVDGPAD
jgi:predicted Abi (CAAX) family protease